MIQLLEPKGWIQGNTRIGPILEVTTSFQHFKFGVEVRIQSMKEDNSHSWVRISFGTIRYVNNYVKYNTHNFASSYEEEAVPASSEVIAPRSKAKAKPQPRESSGTTTIPLSERIWIDIVPSKQDLDSHNLSKKVINLLRHNQKVHREQDGAVQFYKIKFHLRDYSLPIQNWSDNRWFACLAAGGGPKRRYQYCSDSLGSIIYLRALQGAFWGQYHWSGNAGSSVDFTWNISLNLQCRKQFQYLFNGLIPGGQNLRRRQSVFFLPVDPRDENHRDPENIDYSVPRHVRYVHNTWKRHQDTVFWIDINLGIIKERLKFYQTRSNAIILQGVLPPSCIVRAERLNGGEPLYKRQYLSLRPPPKISLRHDLNWTRGNDDLGSTVEHRPVGKLVQQSQGETVHFGSSKPTQSPKTNEDRSEKPVAQEIVGVLQEEPSSSDRTGKPVTKRKNNMSEITITHGDLKERTHSTQCKKTIISNVVIMWTSLTLQRTMRMLTSVSLAFLKKAVKRSENFNILQLIRRITRHPQKQAVQNDLDKEQSFNAFSAESKKAIKEAGNIEISEIINAEPKWQCKSCLNHCNPGVIYCVCGRLMTTDSAENRKYISSTLDSFSIPCLLHQKRQTTWVTGMERAPGCKEYHTANQLAKKCRKREYESIHDRYIRDRAFRRAMDRPRTTTEQMIIEMDKLAKVDHS